MIYNISGTNLRPCWAFYAEVLLSQHILFYLSVVATWDSQNLTGITIAVNNLIPSPSECLSVGIDGHIFNSPAAEARTGLNHAHQRVAAPAAHTHHFDRAWRSEEIITIDGGGCCVGSIGVGYC
jgi:hypothetical protein